MELNQSARWKWVFSCRLSRLQQANSLRKSLHDIAGKARLHPSFLLACVSSSLCMRQERIWDRKQHYKVTFTCFSITSLLLRWETTSVWKKSIWWWKEYCLDGSIILFLRLDDPVFEFHFSVFQGQWPSEMSFLEVPVGELHTQKPCVFVSVLKKE